jgi:predicted aldo/keto reductase-like oxidoreductase
VAEVDRRGFLRAAAWAGLGAGLLPLALPVRAAAEPRVRGTRVLGRTGLRVSDIGFGGSRLRDDVGLVQHALARGIRYFDTAEGYTGGVSEDTLGRALQGRRHDVVLGSKLKAEADGSRADFMRALDGSLRRLRTDYLDLHFNHAVNDPARLRNPEWRAFTRLAKEAGKIRWVGMSGHGGRLVECLDLALDEDLVDVILVGYNFGQDPSFLQELTRSFDFIALQPELPRVLAKAKRRQVGTIAMKTLRGARLNDLRPFETEGSTFAQAAFRWVLSNPDVDSMIVTMRSREEVDEYLGASGWKAPARADRPLLFRYEARNGSRQCRYGCDRCADACPHQVPIPEVLRTRMYWEDYGDRELAAGDYRSLGAGAAACLGCAHRACKDACPFGLPIPELTSAAARNLG